MLLSSEETLAIHRQDHAERVETAERDRVATGIARIRRAERWARRLTRMSTRLDGVARIHRARLS
jgi:hypothetical protein